MTIRVLVADDQPLVRAGLRTILQAQPDIDVVAEAGDGGEAIEAARRARPDVVVMDVRMPNLDGLAATRRLMSAVDPAPRVLVLTTFDLDEYVYGALRAGASGFLLKGASTEQLVSAVRIVAEGDALIAPSVTRRLIAEFARRQQAPARPEQLEELTLRESEVLDLMARGLSNPEIAAELVVSSATVKTHVARILEKLGVRDRVQAVILLYETGVIRPGGTHANR